MRLVIQRKQPGSSSSVSKRLRRLCQQGALVRLFRGLYCDAQFWAKCDPQVRRKIELMGLCLLYPRHVISGRMAASCYGLPVHGEPAAVTLESPTQTRRREYRMESGLRVTLRRTPRYRRHLQPSTAPGLRLAHPLAVLSELARRTKQTFQGFAELLGLLDEATRCGLVPSLQGFGFLRVRNRARSRLHALAALVSRWSESPLESAAKLHLRSYRFVQQAQIADGDQFIARVDFLLPDAGVIVECDGKQKYELDAGRLWQERRRESALTNLGFRVVHCSWADVFHGDAAGIVRRAVQQTAPIAASQLRQYWSA